MLQHKETNNCPLQRKKQSNFEEEEEEELSISNTNRNYHQLSITTKTWTSKDSIPAFKELMVVAKS